MAFEYFYNKQVTFSTSSNEPDDSGFYVESAASTVTVDCDVQPLDSKIDIDETGKLIDAEYKLFCDPDNSIKEESACNYQEDVYSVTKIIRWDDYYIVYIRRVR